MTKTLRLGANRGNARLWLEGFWLIEWGFTRGTRFQLTTTAGQLTLTATADGTRTVSGKLTKDGRQRPIIDVNDKGLSAFAGRDLTLTARPGVLTLTT